MINLECKTPKTVTAAVAQRVRAIRKKRKISMPKLAELSGVSYGSIRRFETTGEISLPSLVKIAIVLDCADDFDALFQTRAPLTIQEVIDGNR